MTKLVGSLTILSDLSKRLSESSEIHRPQVLDLVEASEISPRAHEMPHSYETKREPKHCIAGTRATEQTAMTGTNWWTEDARIDIGSEPAQ